MVDEASAVDSAVSRTSNPLVFISHDTRDAELAEAFSNLGFHGVSMEAIASRVGISAAALYRHYTGKYELFRDAVLSLKQVSITFPKGTTREQAEPIVARFGEAARNVGGCGGADKIATEFHGEIVQQDSVKMRDLPPALQQMMLPLQVGQATQPFGSLDEGVRTLVICGRDEVDPTAPSYDEVYSQLNEERVNSRSRRYLRDLRRDAVIEFR